MVIALEADPLQREEYTGTPSVLPHPIDLLDAFSCTALRHRDVLNLQQMFLGSPDGIFSEVTRVFVGRVDTADTPEGNMILNQELSLRRERLLAGMLPNSIAAHDKDGNFWYTAYTDHAVYLTKDKDKLAHPETIDAQADIFVAETEDRPGGLRRISGFYPDNVNFITGTYAVPVGPWGKRFDCMYIYFGEPNARTIPAWNDMPDHILGKTLKQFSEIIAERRKNGRPVYIGVNNSAGTMRGDGLMSVLEPHMHIWQFGQELDNWSLQDAKDVRANAPWDGGISLALGEMVSEDIAEIVHEYWGISAIQADNMGFMIDMPTFPVDRIGDINFMEKFWKKISLSIHERLRDYFYMYYGNELNQVIDYVLDAHQSNTFDFTTYDQFFANPLPYEEFMMKAEEVAQRHVSALPWEKQMYKKQWHLERYRKMYEQLSKLDTKGMLRKPIGWAGSLRFDNEGAHAAFTFGSVATIPTGPVQGWGIPLVRLPDPLDTKTTLNVTAKYQRLFSTHVSLN